jgi:hypothetical protein
LKRGVHLGFSDSPAVEDVDEGVTAFADQQHHPLVRAAPTLERNIAIGYRGH